MVEALAQHSQPLHGVGGSRRPGRPGRPAPRGVPAGCGWPHRCRPRGSSGDGRVVGDLLVQPGASPPDQRGRTPASQPVEPGQLILDVADRDDQGPTVGVVACCRLQGVFDLAAPSALLAAPAGERLELEQIQTSVIVAELDVTAAVTAAAVQPLCLRMQGAEQHRDHVLVDRLDVGGPH